MKKVLALLLVVATIFCIAACDNGNKDNNPTTTTTTQNSTTTEPNSTTTTVPETTVTTSEPDTTTSTSAKQEETTPAPAPGPKPINGVDPTDPANQNKVVNSVFTSSNGGIQLYVPGWSTYGLYSISMVPSGYTGKHSTNGICVAVYPADGDKYDAPAVFENKTKADFESVLQQSIDSFTKTKINGYTCYKAVTTPGAAYGDAEGNPRPFYHVWVFQTENAKYFINFMQAADDQTTLAEYNWVNGDMDKIAADIMKSIVIFD